MERSDSASVCRWNVPVGVAGAALRGKWVGFRGHRQGLALAGTWGWASLCRGRGQQEAEAELPGKWAGPALQTAVRQEGSPQVVTLGDPGTVASRCEPSHHGSGWPVPFYFLIADLPCMSC